MIDLSNICEVAELRNKDKINELLSQGWILLNTYTITGDFASDQTLFYSLGRLRLPTE